MSDAPTPLELEILNTLADGDETTALILIDLHRAANADDHSDEAKELDGDRLNVVFERLVALGLVARTEDGWDGVSEQRAGVPTTWWSMTKRGWETWEQWAANQDK
jgi:hypothetical protein